MQQSKPTGNPQPLLVPLMACGLVFLFVVALIAPLIQDVLIERPRLLNLLFAASAVPFLLVILISPRWRAAAAIALIFVLPGSIDNVLPRVSIGYTPESALRILSLLDLVFVLVVVLRWPVVGRRKALSPLLLGLILALSTLALLSALSALARLPQYRAAALLTGALPLRMLLVYGFVTVSVRSIDDMKRIMAGVMAGSLGLLANGVYFSFVNHTPRFTAGVFGNNTLGNVLAVLGLVCIGAFLVPGSGRWRYAGLITGGLCAIGIILTGTRMSVIAFGLGVVTLILTVPITVRRRLVLIMCVLIVSASILIVGGQFFTTSVARLSSLPQLILSGNLLGASELQTRFINWDASLQMIRGQPWLGIGSGQWNYDRIDRGIWLWIDVFDPHNGYVLIATEYGVPFFLLYCALIALCFRRGLGALWAARARRDRAAVAMLLSFLIPAGAILLTEMTNAGVFKLHLQLFYWTVLFILATSRRFTQPADGPAPATDARSGGSLAASDRPV